MRPLNQIAWIDKKLKKVDLNFSVLEALLLAITGAITDKDFSRLHFTFNIFVPVSSAAIRYMPSSGAFALSRGSSTKNYAADWRRISRQ